MLGRCTFGRSIIQSSRNINCAGLKLEEFKFQNSSGGGCHGVTSRRSYGDLPANLYLSTMSTTSTPQTIFSDWPVVVTIQDLLYKIHDIPGLNWTGSIILTTLAIKLFIGLPVAIHQQKSIARLEGLKPELKDLADELRAEVGSAIKLYNWDEKIAKKMFLRSYKKHWRRLIEENNCHPMKSIFLALSQAPIWICFSSAIRNVVYILPERTPERISGWNELFNEKSIWGGSLVIPDPILPLLFITSGLINLQLNSRRIKKLNMPQKRIGKLMPWIGGTVILGVGGFAFFVPSALSLYWTTSSVINLCQNILLNHPKAQSFLGIPSKVAPKDYKINYPNSKQNK